MPWAVLALSLGTTAFLYLSISRTLRQRNAEALGAARKGIVAEMNAIARRQAFLLHAAAGAVESNTDINRPRFEVFYNNLVVGAPTRPEAVGLSLFAPWADRGRLVEQARRRGVSSFELRPPEPRPEAHAVILVQPLEGANLKAAGYDMHTEPVRRAAMETARRTREAAMTTRVALLLDGKEGSAKPSVLIYVPLYDPLTGAHFGFVYSALHTREMFAPLFEDAEEDEKNPARKGMSLRLWAGPTDDAHRIYSHVARGEPGEVYRERVALADVNQTLTVEFAPTDNFGAQPVIQRWVPPVGAAISVLLFLLATGQRRAHEATARRAAEQWLIAETGRLTTAGADDDRVLNEVAQAMARVLDAVVRFDLPQPDGDLHWVSTRKENREILAEMERERPRLQYDVRLKAALETGQTQRFDAFVPSTEANRERLERLDIGPGVIVPLRARDRTLGAVTITRRRGQTPLNDDAVGVVEAIAGRMALAIDNARLYREAQEEVRERRAAEAEVRRLNEDLEDIVAERTRDLEASNHELESFCYSVSHDLRTPLRSLDGFGRALKEDYGNGLDEQAHDYIDRIRAATKRMDELITALLTLSRLTRREIVPSEVDATAMAKETMADLDPEGRVAFRVQGGMRVLADPRMLAIVLENLLGNAIKFTGRIEAPKVEVGQSPDGALFVRDNGAGFDPAYGAKLFQPFERLHSVREFPGHGIGLATVERIVRRHGGAVRAEGRPGEGATFYVSFPE